MSKNFDIRNIKVNKNAVEFVDGTMMAGVGLGAMKVGSTVMKVANPATLVGGGMLYVGGVALYCVGSWEAIAGAAKGIYELRTKRA